MIMNGSVEFWTVKTIFLQTDYLMNAIHFTADQWISFLQVCFLLGMGGGSRHSVSRYRKLTGISPVISGTLNETVLVLVFEFLMGKKNMQH